MNLNSSILEARESMQATKLFCIGYKWTSRLGELEGSTVVDSIDAQVAVRSFRSRHPHITDAWVIQGGGQ